MYLSEYKTMLLHHLTVLDWEGWCFGRAGCWCLYGWESLGLYYISNPTRCDTGI